MGLTAKRPKNEKVSSIQYCQIKCSCPYQKNTIISLEYMVIFFIPKEIVFIILSLEYWHLWAGRNLCSWIIKLCHRQNHQYLSASSEVGLKFAGNIFSRNRSFYCPRFFPKWITVFYSKSPCGQGFCRNFSAGVISQSYQSMPCVHMGLRKGYCLTDSPSLDAQSERSAKHFSV